MTSYKVEVIESSPIAQVGEGPHWDIPRQSLYYVDITNDKGLIFRYDYGENKVYSATTPDYTKISFIIPVEDTTDQFIVGSFKKIVLIKWDGKSEQATIIKIVGETEFTFEENRLNDAKCDPSGTFFGGTFVMKDNEKRLGTLYRFTNKEQFVPLKSKIGVANGLAWNEKTNKFYYIDSIDYDVKEYDYDPKTKDISNERVVIDFRVNGDAPKFMADGMTIDENGFLYVATFGGSKVLKINPDTGAIELEIKLPAGQITSAAFGGPNLDILYVTSAATEFASKQPPPAGKLFAVTGLGVRGLPMKNFKMD